MKSSRTILLFAPTPAGTKLAGRLRDARAPLVCAATADQAREAVERLAPFLLVLDLDALGDSVRELLGALRGRTPAPLVFFIGSEAAEPLAIPLLDSGDAIAFFEDPADIASLDTLLATAAEIAPRIDFNALAEPFQPSGRAGEGGKSPPTSDSERYQLLELLGAGAAGVVWKARDHMLDLDVAIKILRDDLSHDEDAVRAMKAEARIAMELSQSNIVRLYNLIRFEGRTSLVMEYIDGSSLETLLGRCGRFDPDFVLGVVDSCAAGLDYAHRHGVLHRDLKPANLLLTTRDTIKIIDFGVAGMLGKGISDEIVGTPVYMAPEQLLGTPLGPSTDLYSLAIVAYQLLTGAVPAEPAPFDPAHPDAYRHGPLVNVSDAVRFVLERATSPRPEDRHRTIAEFARAFRAALRPAALIHP